MVKTQKKKFAVPVIAGIVCGVMMLSGGTPAHAQTGTPITTPEVRWGIDPLTGLETPKPVNYAGWGECLVGCLAACKIPNPLGEAACITACTLACKVLF